MTAAAGSKLLAAFRVDGSVGIGTGHVMRCLTLAEALALRGFKCVFVCRTVNDGLAAWIERAGHDLIRLPRDGPEPETRQGEYGRWLGTTQIHDARATLASLTASGKPSPTVVVVDHYGLNDSWEHAVSSQLKAPILAIDDLNRHHHCDLLLDTTYGKHDGDYRELVPATCHLMVGSSYALLRPDFSRMRAQALARRDSAFDSNAPVRDLLLAMGGGDPNDALGWLLDRLEPLAIEHGLILHALIGSAYPHNDRLTARTSDPNSVVRVHRDVRDVAAFLSRMDLCIGAAGTSTWERCCMGLPTISLVVAENQRDIARTLSKLGAVADGGTFDETIEADNWVDRCVVPYLGFDARKALSIVSREIVDGHGAERVCGAILRKSFRLADLNFRPAEPRDAAILYRWQSFPDTRKYFNNPSIPSWDEHVRWFANTIKSGTSRQFIGEWLGCPVSFVRVENGEISILVDPNLKGLGIASASLSYVKGLNQFPSITAQVHPENAASYKLFVKAGFTRQSDTKLKWEAVR